MARTGLDLPTRRGDWRTLLRVTASVLRRPLYASLAVAYAVAALTTFVLARNLPFVRDVLVGGTLPLRTRLEVVVAMYPGFGPAYTTEQSVVLLATSALVGVNLALLTHYVRHYPVSLRSGAGTTTGVVLGALGAGCATCGSVLLAGVLSLVGASGLLTALPLHGLEIAVLAAGTLVLSTYWLATAIRHEDRRCEVSTNA
ncbi:MAG: hypothetical protein ABEJ88_02315 [Halobacterium sp.]